MTNPRKTGARFPKSCLNNVFANTCRVLLALSFTVGVTGTLSAVATPKRDIHPPMTASIDMSPLIDEIKSIRWNEAMGETRSESRGEATADVENTRRLSLEKALKETLSHNISVRQAEALLKDSDGQPGDPRDPGLLSWLIPVDLGAMKEASRLNTQAARAHLQAAQQKALLESARLYAALTRAYLEKYLAVQGIEQSLRQLETEEKRFHTGESNSFDITRAQMTLIERYNQYLSADTTYKDASSALATQLGLSTEVYWRPEDFSWRDAGEPFVPPVRLFSDELTVEQARRTALANRSDLSELTLKQAALERVVKGTFGPERDKRKVELKQLELEREKALQAAGLVTERAFNAYRLAEKNTDLAQQQAALAYGFVNQLRISYNAGFSSAHELQDGETQLSRARASLTGAQVATNLRRVELVYEMGLLSEDIFSHPPMNLP